MRVHNVVEESVWSQRYDEINAWEDELENQGTVLIKCFLDISSAEQKKRLIARLHDPTKHWKYNPGDVDERAKWPACMGVPRGVRALQYRARPVVRHPIRSPSGIEMGRRPAARRATACARLALACCQLRCRGREGSGRCELSAVALRADHR